jgi:hypothetical protein
MALMDTYDPQRHTSFKVIFTDKMGQLAGTTQSVKTPMLPAAQRSLRDTVLKELIEQFRNRDPDEIERIAAELT